MGYIDYKGKKKLKEKKFSNYFQYAILSVSIIPLSMLYQAKQMTNNNDIIEKLESLS